MPPKRKQNSLPNAVPAKSAKQDETAASLPSGALNEKPILIWQWNSKGNEWKLFTAANEKTINKIYGLKKGQIRITEADEDVMVYFQKMVCVNKVSNVESKIRSGVKVGIDIFVWQWQDIQGEYHPYSPSYMLKLEIAYQSNETVQEIKLGTRKYTFDFKAWTETANTTKEMKIVLRSKLVLANKSSVRRKTLTERLKKEKESGETVQTIAYNGKRPVDPACHKKLYSARVYYERDEVWDVTLNLTNLQCNNNKFYRMQLLEDNNCLNYSVWSHWGRVGHRGRFDLMDCGTNVDFAKKIFQTKFYEKTKNDWCDRQKFEQVPGYYSMLSVDYSIDDMSKISETSKKKKPPATLESKLDKRVKELLELICNIQTMEVVVLEMKYDTKKAPLGKLTAEQIKAGYSALKTVEDLINMHQLGQELIEACSAFYTRIPHCSGMKRPPLITTLPEVKQKVRLLEALSDIQIAIKLLNENTNMDLHPVDNHYKSLDCELVPLEYDHPDYSWIEKYFYNTHNPQQFRLKLLEIFECNKDKEKKRFLDQGNKVMLWHGSRLSNWAGILGKGLQIAPLESPSSGFTFGKGLYFADMCAKSVHYCYATPSMDTGLLLLCEVSLGKCHALKNGDFFASSSLPPGKNSIKGVGRTYPNPADKFELRDKVIVPYGKKIETKDPSESLSLNLQYNEYVVYDLRQVRMRYLVKVKFCYK